MQGLLAEELRALRLDNKGTLLSRGGVGSYSTSIRRVVTGSVGSSNSASLVFPSSVSSSASSIGSLSSTCSAGVTPGSRAGSHKLLRLEEYRDLSEIASHMVNDGYTEELITEFSRNQSSSSSSGGDAVLGTWFCELGVDWVLGVHEFSFHGEPWSAVKDKIKQWIVAFTVMAEALRLTMPALSSDDASAGGVPPLSMDKNGVSSRSDINQGSSDPTRHKSVDVATVKEAIVAYSVAETGAGQFLGFGQEESEAGNHFVIFAEASLMKMLRFPRVVAALQRSPEKILCMIDMYSLVSDASSGLLGLLSGKSKKLLSDEIESVLQTMGEAVCEIVQNLMGLIQAEDSWRRMPGDDDIHPVSRYVLNYVNLLLGNRTVLDSILRQRFGKVPQGNMNMRTEEDDGPIPFVSEDTLFSPEYISSSDYLIYKLIHSLKTMLEKKSRMHAAAWRRYVFLLNNAYLLPDHAETTPRLREGFSGDLDASWIVVPREVQIERYINGYLDASWDHVTDSLGGVPIDTKSRRSSVFRKASALENFNALFEMTYVTHKFRKISSPELRRRLRKAVSDKVVSAYRAYLENHAIDETSAWYSPQDLEDLLQGLFEG